MNFVKKLKTKKQFVCELCGTKEYLVEHHIDGRDIPNPNHSSNLCNICQNCHYKIHLGEIIIEKWTMTTGGKKLFWHNKGDESFTGNDAIPHMIRNN